MNNNQHGYKVSAIFEGSDWKVVNFSKKKKLNHLWLYLQISVESPGYLLIIEWSIYEKWAVGILKPLGDETLKKKKIVILFLILFIQYKF